jgi:hypothetical protein
LEVANWIPGSGWGRMAGSCEQGKEPFGCIKGREFLN